MLVLSRHEGDGIAFPDLDLSVEIVKIQGSRVQVGVKAPKEIQVLRSELVGRPAPSPSPTARPGSLSSVLTLAEESATMATQRLLAARRALDFAERHLQHGDLERAESAMQLAADALRPANHRPADATPYAASCPIATALSNSVSEPTATYAVTHSTDIAASTPSVRQNRRASKQPLAPLASASRCHPETEGLAC